MNVDAVTVSYNSRGVLRQCVKPLAEIEGVTVIVVDNASQDDSLDSIADLGVALVPLPHNHGFAFGCNVGWRDARSEYVLFTNPDTRVDEAAVRTLAGVLDREPATGIVGPRILKEDGALDYSQRRFPRARSTFSQALFLHRLFPTASWVDELVRDPAVYDEPGSPEWVSGACLMIRRSLLEQLGGLDEGFFMYSEDIDLCKRTRDAGYDVRYEPAATIVHVGGASAPRASLLPVLARSRVRYAKKHSGRVGALLEQIGIVLGGLTHMAVSKGGRAARAGHARAVRAVAQGYPSG